MTLTRSTAIDMWESARARLYARAIHTKQSRGYLFSLTIRSIMMSSASLLLGSMSFVSSSNSQGICSGSNTVAFSLGTLANAANATVTIVV